MIEANLQRPDHENEYQTKLLDHRHLQTPHHRNRQQEKQDVRDDIRHCLYNIDGATIDARSLDDSRIPGLVDWSAWEYQCKDRSNTIANDDDTDDNADDS